MDSRWGINELPFSNYEESEVLLDKGKELKITDFVEENINEKTTYILISVRGLEGE